MEARRFPLRKVREDSRLRMEAEQMKIDEDKAKKSKGDENQPPRKRATNKQKKEEETTKSTDNSKDAVVVTSKAAPKKKAATKQPEAAHSDVESESQKKTIIKRRSRSADAPPMKPLKKVVTKNSQTALRKVEEQPEENKKDPEKPGKKKVLKALTESPEEKEDEAKEAPAAKGKKRGAKAVAVKQDSAEEEEATKVTSTAKGRKRVAKASLTEAPEEAKEASAGKGKKQIVKAVATMSDDSEEEDVKEASEKITKMKVTSAEVSEEDEGSAEEAPETATKKRGAKAAAAVPTAKRARGGKATGDGEDDESSSSKGGKKLLNNVDTNYSEIDFNIKEKFNLKISSWNVAGLKALAKKNTDYFTEENADIFCLNELKCTGEDDVPDVFKLDGYHSYWNIQKGSGGVAVLSKVEPQSVVYDLPGTDFEDEKRAITLEYQKFYLVSVYVVNSGRGLKTLEKRLEWNDAFDAHVLALDKKKPVIIAGDMNVSHQEIDLANPKANKKNAGFTQEERDGFSKLLAAGFTDTFRHFFPNRTGAYTFWTYMSNSRAKNVGWRLDYFIVSNRSMKQVVNTAIREKVLGSDHCPIVLFLNL